jgi:hypothetical protein
MQYTSSRTVISKYILYVSDLLYGVGSRQSQRIVPLFFFFRFHPPSHIGELVQLPYVHLSPIVYSLFFFKLPPV